MQYTGPDHAIGELRFLRADLDDAVLTITLDHPARRNAINVEMALELDALLKAVHIDTQVRVAVLRGAGEGFCAGEDLASFSDTARHGDSALRAARELANDSQRRGLRLLPQPVIALVHGYCEGAALGLLESCDIVMAADDARFLLVADPDSGLAAGGPSGKAIARAMQPRAASYYALTGASFDGREAERNGLATRSLPPAELEAETYALARELAAKEPIALRFTKETLLHAPDMSWDGVLNFTAAKFAELKLLQQGQPSVRAGAIESFLAGKSKPGLGNGS